MPDWRPRDIYPLRKDVEYSFRPTPQVHYAKFIKPVETGIVPLGPYHPALHEPEYFELYVEGEKSWMLDTGVSLTQGDREIG
ncbi:MAG: hypothetical protein QXU13_06055 [Desulfurococcaceae archaeon]